jgi:serine/threonine-protein kinase RsbT
MDSILRVRIRTEFDVMRASLETTQLAKNAGFGETPSRMIATAVSELARNILKYARTGEIRVQRVSGRRGVGIELVARDEGPGIEDTDAAMSDHFSTGRTLGLGLPGVRRLMDDFLLESTPGAGTCVTATKWI